MPNKFHAFDKRLEHRAPASAALTATATLGTIPQRAAQRTTFLTRFNLEAIKVSAGNEAYNIVIEASNDAFATFETMAAYTLGDSTVRLGGAPDNVAGQLIELLWCTEQAGQVWDDVRIRLIVAGTAPSISLSAYSTIMPGA